MYDQNTPIFILKEGTERQKGKGAQQNNIAAAKTVADAVRSSLGPKGMDKMLVDGMGDVVITNDGVTILKEMDIEHPAAKMMVEVSKAQDMECGDGTTTAVILAGELLRTAEEMIDQNVHPTIIVSGYRNAAEKAREILEKTADKITIKDRDNLKKIAMTAMMSKSVSASREHLAGIAVDAVAAVAEKDGSGYAIDKDNIQMVKKQGAAMEETELIRGVIVDKEPTHPGMPKQVKKAKIALVDSALEVKKTEIDAKIQITDPSNLQAFLDEEEKMLRGMVDYLKDVGASVLFCQKGIDDLAQHYLAKEGIYAVRRVKKSDMEKLSKAIGANIVTKLKELRKDDLGVVEIVELKKVGGEDMTFVTGCKNPKAVSVLLRGGTEHVVAEVERSFTDAISVVSVALEDGKIVTGGGSMAIELALGLRDYATQIGGRAQIAINAFADALEVIPRTLAENAGHDPIDVLINMRAAHKNGNKYAGLNANTGEISNMKRENVLEPLRVGMQAISSATDAATMILRIDDVIASKGGGSSQSGGPGGMGGGMDMM